jgi:hypothetical protein
METMAQTGNSQTAETMIRVCEGDNFVYFLFVFKYFRKKHPLPPLDNIS